MITHLVVGLPCSVCSCADNETESTCYLTFADDGWMYVIFPDLEDKVRIFGFVALGCVVQAAGQVGPGSV